MNATSEYIASNVILPEAMSWANEADWAAEMARTRGVNSACTSSRYPSPPARSGWVGTRRSFSLDTRPRKKHHSTSRQSQRSERKRNSVVQTIQYHWLVQVVAPTALELDPAVRPDRYSKTLVLRCLVWVETTSGGRTEVKLSGDEIDDCGEVSN